jgi:hypothetical protein
MPDPRLFVQGLVAAAVVSLLIIWGLAGGRSASAAGGVRWRWVLCLGWVAGLATGWVRLGYAIPWPPATGLDRLLILVLPLAMASVLCGSEPERDRGTDQASGARNSLRGWLAVGLAGLRSLVVPWVLLWGSVHLTGGGAAAHFPSGPGCLFVASGVLLGLGESSLRRLLSHPAGWMVPASLIGALLTAGTCVLLAGYIKGGAIAFPLAGALLGGLLATSGRQRAEPVGLSGRHAARRVLVTLGTISLYGVLFVGAAFGRLPGGRALLIGVTPLVGWVTEWSLLRRWPARWLPWVRGVAMALPLGLALVSAKRDFERTLGPLVGHRADPKPQPSSLEGLSSAFTAAGVTLPRTQFMPRLAGPNVVVDPARSITQLQQQAKGKPHHHVVEFLRVLRAAHR